MDGKIQNVLGNLLMFSAVWLTAAKTSERKLFHLRSVVCFAAYCALRYLYFYVVLPVIPMAGNGFLVSRIIGFVLLMVLLAVASAVCFKLDIWGAIFVSSIGYCTQHICQRMYSIFTRLWTTGETPAILYVLIYVGCMAFLLGILFFALRRMKIRSIVVNNYFVVISATISVFATIVLSLNFTGGIRGNDRLWYSIKGAEIIMAALIIMFLFSILVKKRADIEKAAVKRLLEESREQYMFEKSLIETINVRVHDLKHQIAGLDEAAKKQLYEQTEMLAQTYDSTFRTNNTALDVVLTRQNFRCREEGIELTYYGKGELLSFMSEIDIYTLFGNLIDNAIEAVKKLSDENKRVITLFVEERGGFVHLHSENFFDGTLLFENGVIRTTKKDNELHGYGIKSIRMIVEKYGGNLKFSTKEERFVADALFEARGEERQRRLPDAP